ncbi:Mov34/MPN/PAD-1 family protein [Paraprevotella clara]|uniref:Mov34/MPN/PAD-1 family protein n=1 Tax=Paraprevotella clara TaxID=454154 RepID=UPI003FEFE5BE
MKYYLASNDLYIEIPTVVFNQIKLQAEGEYPNENGGMLAGRYSTDRHTVYIEKVVVPVEKLTGRTKFMRITKGLENVWEQLAKEGLQYVGEWHSHPNGSTQIWRL